MTRSRVSFSLFAPIFASKSIRPMPSLEDTLAAVEDLEPKILAIEESDGLPSQSRDQENLEHVRDLLRGMLDHLNEIVDPKGEHLIVQVAIPLKI